MTHVGDQHYGVGGRRCIGGRPACGNAENGRRGVPAALTSDNRNVCRDVAMVEPRSSKFLNSNVVRLAVADSRRSCSRIRHGCDERRFAGVGPRGAPGRSRRRQGTTRRALVPAVTFKPDQDGRRSTAQRHPAVDRAAVTVNRSAGTVTLWEHGRIRPDAEQLGTLAEPRPAAPSRTSTTSCRSSGTRYERQLRKLGGPADATLTRSILPSKFAGSTLISSAVSFAPPSPNGLADCPCFGECGWLDGRAGYEPSTRTARDMLRSAGQSTVELGTYSTMATSSGCDCTTAWIGTAPVLLR